MRIKPKAHTRELAGELEAATKLGRGLPGRVGGLQLQQPQQAAAACTHDDSSLACIEDLPGSHGSSGVRIITAIS